MKIASVFIGFILCLVSPIYAQNPPSIEGWNAVTKFHYEIKNYIESPAGQLITSSYVGSANMYRNSQNTQELLMVIVKYPAFTIVPKPVINEMRSPGNVVTNYSQSKKQEEFAKRLASADPIAFIKWSESKDPRTGEQMLSGPIENWLLTQNGEWFFESSNSPEIKVELISEPDTKSLSDSKLVGFKIYINSHYHILRVNQ